MSDDFTESDECAVLCECERCGKEAWCVFAVNPYVAEIYPDEPNEEAWWCGPCLSEIAADI